MENKTGVIWVRVSSEPQALGYSPEVQREALETACKQRGIKVVKSYVVAESAKTSEKRKSFKEMLEFVRTESIPFLVVKNTSRLTRNYRDMFTIEELVEKDNLSVFLVDEGRVISKTSSPQDRFLFRILGAVYQQENENRGVMAREGMIRRAQKGKLPHIAPFGYRNVDGEIIKIEEEAALVPWIFEAYASGDHSLETLRDEIERKGFRLSQRGVQEILKRSCYYGYFLFAGQMYPWNQEPLISKDLFDRVQLRLTQACTSPHKNSRKWFAFKRFLRCGYCQSSITAEIQSGLTYYRCTYGKSYNHGRCPQKYFREEEIDEIIASEIGSLEVDRQWIEELKERLRTDSRTEDRLVENEKKRLANELTRLRNRSMKLIDGWADGVLNKEQYKAKQSEYSARMAQVEEDLKSLDRTNLKYKEQGAEILDLLRHFPEYYRKADLKSKQALLSVCLDQLILRSDQYQISWKPPFDMLFPLALIKSQERGE